MVLDLRVLQRGEGILPCTLPDTLASRCVMVYLCAISAQIRFSFNAFYPKSLSIFIVHNPQTRPGVIGQPSERWDISTRQDNLLLASLRPTSFLSRVLVCSIYSSRWPSPWRTLEPRATNFVRAQFCLRAYVLCWPRVGLLAVSNWLLPPPLAIFSKGKMREEG